jgi:hypothetical protein
MAAEHDCQRKRYRQCPARESRKARDTIHMIPFRLFTVAVCFPANQL